MTWFHRCSTCLIFLNNSVSYVQLSILEANIVFKGAEGLFKKKLLNLEGINKDGDNFLSQDNEEEGKRD